MPLFVLTKDNVADFFTKPLTGKMFFDMRDKVMNVPRAHRTPRARQRNRDTMCSACSADGGVLRTEFSNVSSSRVRV